MGKFRNLLKYYRPPKTHGREYVTAVEGFANVTYFRCERLPKMWKHDYLDPLIECVNGALSCVSCANRVWLSPKSQTIDETVRAYNDRIRFLEKALWHLASFDTYMDRLLNRIDLVYAEKGRLKDIILEIIEEVKKLPPEERADPDIKISYAIRDVVYTTCMGTKRIKLQITEKNVGYWLKHRNYAEEKVSERLTKDRDELSFFMKKAQ